jgi:TonB-linked SusC/RagA family outer membrane protein
MQLTAYCKGSPVRHPLLKTWLVMKMTAFLLLITCLQVYAKGYAQTITLKEKDAPLQKIFQEIKKQSGCNFVYAEELLKAAKKVTVDLKDASLDEVLAWCFKEQPFTYVISDKIVIIKPKETTTPANPLPPTLIDIKGIVTNEANIGIPGASIIVTGTKRATLTNENGEFSLTGIDSKAIIVINSIGYEIREVNVNGRTYISIALKEHLNELDKVVIIPYGQTTQRLSTGNIGIVTSEQISEQPVSNPLAALEGRVSGLVVTQTNGISGSAIKINVRGMTSVSAIGSNALISNDPLFIVDGVPFAPNNNSINQLSSVLTLNVNGRNSDGGGVSPFNSINPSDIESIEILKDADATSIYGSRGSNGVVLITTKKGKAGKTKFNLNVYTGVSNASGKIDYMDSKQYLAMRREALKNGNIEPDNDNAYDLLVYDTTRYTDFQKLFWGGSANTTDAQASISGGSANTQFRLGASYHKETTVIPGDLSDNKGSFHVNLNHQSSDRRFSASFSAMYGYGKNNLLAQSFASFLTLPPDYPSFFDANGNLVWEYKGLPVQNPMAYLYQTYQLKTDNLNANLQLSYQLLKGLSVRSSFGYSMVLTNEMSLDPSKSEDPSSGNQNSSSFANTSYKNWIIEPQLEYKTAWHNNKITFLAGSTIQNNIYSSTQLFGANYPNDALLQDITAAAIHTPPVSNYTNYKYAALFGRLTFNRSDKYIFNLSGRRDGSSRFGPDRQFANFWSAAGNWIFSSEQQFQKLFPFISFGKIRASYGTTGNDKIGDYKYLNTWSPYFANYQGNNTLVPTLLNNPDYSWEVNKKLEFGADFGFLKDRILFSVAYYLNRCNNQLINYKLPNQAGFPSIVANFPAVVQNNGLEIQVDSKNVKSKTFNWTTSINFSLPKNKLINFPGLSTSSYANSLVIGQPLSVYAGYRYVGVDPQTGLYQFSDAHNTPTTSPAYPADYLSNLGNTDPVFYGGIRNSLNYKSFTLNIFFDFKKQIGTTYLYQIAAIIPGTINNLPSYALNHWQKPGDNTVFAQLNADPTSAAYQSASILATNASSIMYGDASFLRLKNVSLQYALPKNFLNRLHVEACSLYIQAQNLITFTGYKGADPETQNILVLPPLRTITGGININF